MTSALIVALSLFAADSTTTSSNSVVPSALDREAYQAARAKAGGDPDANVRLALWCEAHGLDAERLKHLSLAALADPRHASARALLGMVSVDGRWGRPESVADRLKADPKAASLRTEYESRRSKTEATADDQWKLARWCEQVGLSAEATAHDTAVTRLDPSRDGAWKKLGCRKFEGWWMTPAQIVALRSSRAAQGQADRHWQPLLERWKDNLERQTRRAEAEEGFLSVTDPLAVRSIFRVFATGGPADQTRAVRLYGQVDSTDASRGLAALAVFGRTNDVRRQAIETLRGRDLRGALEPIIGLLRDPIKFEVKRPEGPESPGRIFIEGKDANFERIYPINRLTANDIQRLNRAPQTIDQTIERATQRFNEDVKALVAQSATIDETNRNALAALIGVTGKALGADQVAWMAWWTDKKGYAFQAPEPTSTAPRPTITQILDPYEQPRHSCFAAGTSVQTIDGPRAIEKVQVGDRLLTQDPGTGILSYQPTLAIFHNPPAETLRLKIGGEDVVATGIHRFWKVGQGWVMARELKVGDPIRKVGGSSRVESIEADKKQPVFNLEVASGADFFVGKSSLLVHDNHLVETVAKPFDATP